MSRGSWSHSMCSSNPREVTMPRTHLDEPGCGQGGLTWCISPRRIGRRTATVARHPPRRCWLEVQALEVIPEDLGLVGHTFPVGDVQRSHSGAAARAQL